jgi:hypothetical protein
MPAIHPARLKQQAALLAEHFYDPPAYTRSLHHLFESYAERVYRAGQAGEPPPLLASYRVRPPVIRQVLRELTPLAEEDPQAALTLCDQFWAQPYLEFHQLAASLLGEIPADHAQAILLRVHLWLQPDLEERLVQAVLQQGMARLRREAPQKVLQQIDDWLQDRKSFYKKIGLQAMLGMVNETWFDNLPVFFRLLQPYVRQAPTALRPEVLDLIEALAHRSARETAFFLEQVLAIPNSPDIAWLIRQSSHAFPQAEQEHLRNLVRNLEWESKGTKKR